MSVLVSGVWPSTAPAGMQSTSMNRANTCASGMNSERARAGLADDLVQVGDGVDRELVEVAVRQLDALGAAGRARRVDDRGDVGEHGEAAASGDLLVGHRLGAGQDRLDRAVVEQQHLAQGRGVRADLLDGGGVRGGLDDEERHVRVGEDPQHLLGGGRLVQGHGDGADGPDGPVEQRPLVPRVGHDPDPVTGLHPAGDQALGDRDDLGVELLRGQRDPGPARAAPCARRRPGRGFP